MIADSVAATNLLLATFSNCFADILLASGFQTVALIYTNKSIDLASDLYTYNEILTRNDFGWNVYNLDINYTKKRFRYERMFQIYVLNSLSELDSVYVFLKLSRFNLYDEKAIVLINRKPSIQMINYFVRYSCAEMQFFNLAFIFLEHSLQFFKCSGFDYQIVLTTVPNATCPIDISELLYDDKMVQMEGISLNVRTTPQLPRLIRTVGRTANNEIMKSIDGLDVMICEVIDKFINFTPMYIVVSTPTQTLLSIDETLFNVSVVPSYHVAEVKTDQEFPNISTDPMFNVTVSPPDNANYLYWLKHPEIQILSPHDTDSFIIIVPKQLRPQQQLINLFESPLFLAWGLIVVSIAFVRLFLARLTKSVVQVSDVFLDTFGLSIGKSTEVKVCNASENVLTWFFCLATMLFGMILSTFLFQGFAFNYDVPTINSLKDLRQSEFQLHAPTSTTYVEILISEFDIRNTIATHESDITSMVVNGYTGYAYMIRKSIFDVVVSNKTIWNVIHQFDEIFLSFSLKHLHHLDNRFNVIIQRLVEHGIVIHLKNENARIFKSKGYRQVKLIANSVDSISVDQIQPTFFILLVGFLLAVFSLLAEYVVPMFNFRTTKQFLK